MTCLSGGQKPAESPAHSRGPRECSLKISQGTRVSIAVFLPKPLSTCGHPAHQEGDSHSQQRAALCLLRVRGQNVPPLAGHPCELASLWPLSFIGSFNTLSRYRTKSPISFGVKGIRNHSQDHCVHGGCLHSSCCVLVIILRTSHTLSPLMPTATLKWAPLLGPLDEDAETLRVA